MEENHELNHITKFLSGESDQRPDNAPDFEEFEKVWHLVGNEEKSDFDADAAWDKVQPHITIDAPEENQRTNFWTKELFMVAASVMLLFSVGLYIFKSSFSSLGTMEYVAQQRSEYKLQDNSMVQLEKGSSLTTVFNDTMRQTTLVGKATFDVTKQDVPFFVHTTKTTIKVVGTKFTVSTFDTTSVKVDVEEGTVWFYGKNNPTQKRILTAGQSAKYDREVGFEVEEKQALDDLNIKHVLSIQDGTVEELFHMVDSVYNTNSEIQLNATNCVVNGKFSHQSLDELLKKIELGVDWVKVQRNGINISVHGEACN